MTFEAVGSYCFFPLLRFHHLLDVSAVPTLPHKPDAVGRIGYGSIDSGECRENFEGIAKVEGGIPYYFLPSIRQRIIHGHMRARHLRVVTTPEPEWLPN